MTYIVLKAPLNFNQPTNQIVSYENSFQHLLYRFTVLDNIIGSCQTVYYSWLIAVLLRKCYIMMYINFLCLFNFPKWLLYSEQLCFGLCCSFSQNRPQRTVWLNKNQLHSLLTTYNFYIHSQCQGVCMDKFLPSVMHALCLPTFTIYSFRMLWCVLQRLCNLP